MAGSQVVDIRGLFAVPRTEGVEDDVIDLEADVEDRTIRKYCVHATGMRRAEEQHVSTRLARTVFRNLQIGVEANRPIPIVQGRVSGGANGIGIPAMKT